MSAPSLSQEIIDYSDYYTSQCGYLFTPYGAKGYGDWKTVLPSGWMLLNYHDIDYVPDTKVTWSLDAGTLTISGWGVQKYAEYRYDDAPYFPNKSKVKKTCRRGRGYWSLLGSIL